jgi:hypothetical protein
VGVREAAQRRFDVAGGHHRRDGWADPIDPACIPPQRIDVGQRRQQTRRGAGGQRGGVGQVDETPGLGGHLAEEGERSDNALDGSHQGA